MHPESLALMEMCLDRIVGDGPEWLTAVLDCGSFDVNGSYRELITSKGFRYIGLDVRAGPNVDIVTDDPYRYPIEDNSYDTVICGNMLHNVQAFWLMIPEMARVLRSGGLLAIVAPNALKPASGKYPVDCWRFRPDGLTFLFDETKVLRDYIIEESGMDVVASAIKYV